MTKIKRKLFLLIFFKYSYSYIFCVCLNYILIYNIYSWYKQDCYIFCYGVTIFIKY